MRFLVPMIALVWAGVSLGGNLIAAPAKFVGTDLSTQILLQVGQAQFNWLGITEWVLVALLMGFALFVRSKSVLLFAIPVMLFIIQQSVLMPILEVRTMRQIVGETLDHSPLHLVFVLIEVVKLIGLLVTSLIFLNTNDRQSET